MKNIFITGGVGYVGLHCVVSLEKNCYIPIILNNFLNSHQSVIKKLEKITNPKINFYDIFI